MANSNVPEDEYMTAKEFLLRYPEKKALLDGTFLKGFVSWVLIEREGGTRAQTYVLMSARGYKKACSAKLDKLSLDNQLKTLFANARRDDKTIKELRKENRNQKLQLDKSQKANDAEKVELAKDRTAARSLLDQLKTLRE
jgi:hypothetical protein